MKHSRSIMLATAAAAGLLAATPSQLAASPLFPAACDVRTKLSAHEFQHDFVLGTSMELLVHTACNADAQRCHAAVFTEIERLCAILDTRRTDSHISQVRKGAAVGAVELSELLQFHALWRDRTGGAIDADIGAVIDLWKRAARENYLPSDFDLANAPRDLNIDGLGKAYVIDRCVQVARQLTPAGLLNIGGDIRAWGGVDWTIGVADAARPHDNAPPLATFTLREGAVASSGGYARFFTIAGRRFSHIIDPRTRAPVDPRAAATAVADDCVTANALATALCILDPREGDALAAQFGRGHVVAHANVINLPGAQVARPQPLAAAANSLWPKDFQVSVNVSLPSPQGRKVKRPYVAVWIEDAAGKPVRTITLWGDKPKWVREMTYWWKATGGDQKVVRSVTRATRAPGEYTIVWDGLDDAGKPVQQGEYRIVVEVNREHGRHVREAVTLKCAADKQSAELKATPESNASKVEYAPRAK